MQKVMRQAHFYRNHIAFIALVFNFNFCRIQTYVSVCSKSKFLKAHLFPKKSKAKDVPKKLFQNAKRCF